MKILAIDTSAGPASCAVAEEGRLLASAFQNTRLTHSQTLLPMVESMLRGAALTLEEMDLLAGFRRSRVPSRIAYWNGGRQGNGLS